MAPMSWSAITIIETFTIIIRWWHHYGVLRCNNSPSGDRPAHSHWFKSELNTRPHVVGKVSDAGVVEMAATPPHSSSPRPALHHGLPRRLHQLLQHRHLRQLLLHPHRGLPRILCSPEHTRPISLWSPSIRHHPAPAGPAHHYCGGRLQDRHGQEWRGR